MALERSDEDYVWVWDKSMNRLNRIYRDGLSRYDVQISDKLISLLEDEINKKVSPRPIE